MRDITLEDTIYLHFTTRAFATGVPATLAGTPVIKVLESNNAVPITAGITLSVDRASVVGLNEVAIVASSANGYEVGKSYSAYISTGTVGGTSVVGEVVAQFTVQASAAAVDLANATDGLGAIKADSAAILVDTGTTLDAALAVIDANVDLVLADTNELQTDNIPGTLTTIASYIDTEVAAIKAKTDNLPAAPAATGDIPTAATIAAAALTTQITEAYRANAAAPTLAQFMSEVLAHLGEVAISATTKTINKLDHSTPAATFTLDSATDPSTITRAS